MNCLFCDKTFSSKYTLKTHLDRQVCQKRIKKVCQLCGKNFSSCSGLVYHTQNKVCCKASPINIDTQKPKLVLKTTYNELKQKVAYLEGKVEALTTNPTTINNNIIVFPKEFGKEDMKYIQEKLGDFMGPLIKNHTFNSIPCLFKRIHDNQQIPEYHNVFAKSERSNYALVSDGETFKHQPKKTIIDQIIESKRSILNEYIDENGDQLGDSVLKKYEKYQDRIDDDTEFRKKLELEIGGMLLDMNDVIANDEKTRKLLDKVDKGQFDLLPNEGDV
jgi:hypothetical protein